MGPGIRGKENRKVEKEKEWYHSGIQSEKDDGASGEHLRSEGLFFFFRRWATSSKINRRDDGQMNKRGTGSSFCGFQNPLSFDIWCRICADADVLTFCIPSNV